METAAMTTLALLGGAGLGLIIVLPMCPSLSNRTPSVIVAGVITVAAMIGITVLGFTR